MRPAWVPGLFIIVSIDSSPPFWNIYDGYPIPPKIVSLRKACELWVCDILPNSSTSWSREFWTAFTMKVCWLNWLLKSASIFSSNDLNSPGTNASITEDELRSQKFGCSAWSTVPRVQPLVLCRSLRDEMRRRCFLSSNAMSDWEHWFILTSGQRTITWETSLVCNTRQSTIPCSL